MADKIVHFDIPVDDVEKARKFYTQVFGWKFSKADMLGMEYWLINTGSKEVGGGLYKKVKPNQVPANYAGVKSIDASMKKFQKAGGKIILEKMEVPKMGWVGMGLDPAGNAIGFWQATARPSRRAGSRSSS